MALDEELLMKPPGKGAGEACFRHMAAAYAEASGDGTLTVPQRQVAYSLRRRVLNDGTDVKMEYILGGRGYFIERYMAQHPEETAGWDVICDPRGTLHEPHGFPSVDLGTAEVRDYLRRAAAHTVSDDDRPPPLDLELERYWPTRGPRHRFGAVLYIEKEGFAELISSAGLQDRWDLAVVAGKGYSVRAARAALVEYAGRYDVKVLVAHDFDKDGLLIHHRIREEVLGAVSVGLRLDDLDELPEDRSEPCGGKNDPRKALRDSSSVSDEELDYLVREVGVGASPNPKHRDVVGWNGRRVELNALTGPEFVAWLERKLGEHGVEKVVPDRETLAAAYRRARARRRVNERLEEMREEYERAYRQEAERAAREKVPPRLQARVRAVLGERPEEPWDDVLAEMEEEDGDE